MMFAAHATSAKLCAGPSLEVQTLSALLRKSAEIPDCLPSAGRCSCSQNTTSHAGLDASVEAPHLDYDGVMLRSAVFVMWNVHMPLHYLTSRHLGTN